MTTTHTTHRTPVESEPYECADARLGTHPDRERTVIPVLEEQLSVGTRRVEIEAGVRVKKTVQEREERIDEPLAREDVDVERVAVNRIVDGPVEPHYEGDTLVLPVLEEVLVVEKRLVLKEELRVTRRRREYRAPQRVVLRSEHAEVERIEAPGATTAAPASTSLRPAGERSSDSLIDEKRRHNEEVRSKLR